MSTTKDFLVAPSVLAADFGKMAEAVKRIEQCGADMIHLDIMDGVFVPPITFGSQMVAAIRKCTSLPLDVHLMVAHPENHVDNFINSGADYLTFHFESVIHHQTLIKQIKSAGAKAGISIVPSTSENVLNELLPELDLVLVMSVNPGYGGQVLIPQTMNKLKRIVEKKQKHGYHYISSVDGGVNSTTIDLVHSTGVDMIVAGSAFFNADDPCRELKVLKNLV